MPFTPLTPLAPLLLLPVALLLAAGGMFDPVMLAPPPTQGWKDRVFTEEFRADWDSSGLFSEAHDGRLGF
jgi:hypothetical protein